MGFLSLSESPDDRAILLPKMAGIYEFFYGLFAKTHFLSFRS